MQQTKATKINQLNALYI